MKTAECLLTWIAVFAFGIYVVALIIMRRLDSILAVLEALQ